MRGIAFMNVNKGYCHPRLSLLHLSMKTCRQIKGCQISGIEI